MRRATLLIIDETHTVSSGLGGWARGHVVRVGARVEFICAPGPLQNGAQAMDAHVPAVERAVHLALVNRGCLIAPFHNMMLVCPATKKRQVDGLIGAFVEVLEALFKR